MPSFEEDESLVETTEEEDISSITLIRHKCKAKTRFVATLALGSRPRQRGCKGAGQEEARESHQRLPGV